MQWDGQLYVDTVLPFGLRSSPKIFNCIADALQWIAKWRGISYLDHYLDDFITAGAPECEECSQNLSILTDTCDILCLPMVTDKQEGPTTCIIFLRIELDTEKLELRLLHHKLLQLKSLLQCWAHFRSVKREIWNLWLASCMMQALLFPLDAPLFTASLMLLNQHTSVPLFGSISKLALIFYGGHPSLSIGTAYL